ncbi:unnamed protein product [Eruca vesicaria subsp. sativa]|uniref:FHA domain-containing protein n=1 Tax=Eruca vesicaria subsp. sativa TaxID=29727 RepID=A0ABC8LRN0_ERUVS|nr:unnamed protein product [Eruca vesicaria subsp. sativa]
MTPPLLKLAFVQGPRDGETLQYKPGSTIRIGRVVRGNEIAIKDAGISTKHLRIVSDSENWIIHDLGSSNGTILNSETLDPDTPVTLRHGDVIKLGEYSSIVVNFEIEEEEEEAKLPPKPRRNTRRVPVPDLIPKEKPKRRGRSAKEEEEPEPAKRARVTRSKVAVTKEEEEKSVAVEKKGNVRGRGGGKKKSEAVLNSVKLEVEDTPKGVEMSGVKKRATRSSRMIVNVKSEDTCLEEEMGRPLRATRSKRKEIGGDSFLDLDMVLSQARAKRKKVEQKSVVKEVEARDEVVEEDKEDGKGVEAQKGSSETSDKEVEEASKRFEIESRKSTLGEDDVEEDKQNEKDVSETSDKDDETSKRVEIEPRKSTLGEEDVVEDKQNEKGVSETSDKEDETSIRVEIELGKSTLGEEDVVEDKENEKDVSGTSDKEDETCERVEQTEIESMKNTLGEDGEGKNLQDAVDSDEAGIETSDGGCNNVEEEKAEQESRNEKKDVEKVDLEKMTLGDWFKYMEVYLRKKIVDETEEKIEAMRAKSRRVHQYIAEQKGKVNL